MKAKTIVAVVAVLVVSVAAFGQVTIETVPVGNPGNAGEVQPQGTFGAVSYDYNIGKYEVTAGQYTEFLNAVATVGDPHGLYNANMGDSFGCQITQNGDSGNYTYDFSGRHSGTVSYWANRPVNYVGWGDAARFANWLHNGQPTGAQDSNTTEDGAYYLNGATNDAALLEVTRKVDWKWAIPAEDEWYKAAYHMNDGNTGNYYDYPTDSNSVPSNVLGEPTDPGNNATFYDDGYTNDIPYSTEFGAHENSDSPYGTFDQGGNVWEWNQVIIGSYRGMRGGGFYSLDGSSNLLASSRYSHYPTGEGNDIGFRVVQIPEPATLSLLALGGLAMLRRRRR